MTNKILGLEIGIRPFTLIACLFLLGQLLIFLLDWSYIIAIMFPILFVGLLFKSNRSDGIVFIFRIAFPLVFAMLSLYVWELFHEVEVLNRFLLNPDVDQLFIELFYQIVATLYAVCTAFLLWKGLTDFDELRGALRSESDEIHSILSLMLYFEVDKTEGEQDAYDKGNMVALRKLKEKFQEYIANMLKDGKVWSSPANAKILRDSVLLIAKLRARDENDKIALAELVKSINDLAMMRSKRVSCVERSMSPYILIALFVMSMAILFPFYSFSPPSLNGDSNLFIAVILMSTLFSFMFVTLLDISRPFDGYWSVKVDALSGIQMELQKELEKSDASAD